MGLKSLGFAEIVEGRINISPPGGPEMRPNRPKIHENAENNPKKAKMNVRSPGFVEIVEGRINISPPVGPDMRPNRLKIHGKC